MDRRERRLDELDPFNAMLAILEIAARLDVLAERGAVVASGADGITFYKE